MATKTFSSWFKNLDHVTRRNLKAEDVWEAATKAVEEKFTYMLSNTHNMPLCKCDNVANIHKCADCDTDDFTSHL